MFVPCSSSWTSRRPAPGGAGPLRGSAGFDAPRDVAPVDARPVEGAEPRLEKLRLVVPEGLGKQAEVLGRGPDAAPAVVEVLQKLGVA